MSGFGSNPTTGTQGSLPANQFPLSSVAVPGTANGDLTALEGGPASTDSNGNKTAPVSMYIKDGGDTAQGATTDTAVTSDANGTISAKLRGLVKIFADIWDSTNHRIHVDGSGVTQPISVAQTVTVAYGGTTATGVPSNSGVTVVKASAGRLASAIVTTSGTTQLNIYDNASQASGTIIGAVPANAAVGSVYAFNAPAQQGIVANSVASCCSVTICYY